MPTETAKTGVIYKQHRAAFPNAEAYVVLRDNKQIATVALKLPREKDGRVYAFVQWIGLPMVRAYAEGDCNFLGPNNTTAAMSNAAYNMPIAPTGLKGQGSDLFYSLFRGSILFVDERGWKDKLEANGFTVLRAL